MTQRGLSEGPAPVLLKLENTLRPPSMRRPSRDDAPAPATSWTAYDVFYLGIPPEEVGSVCVCVCLCVWVCVCVYVCVPRSYSLK